MLKKIITKLKHDWDFYYIWLFLSSQRQGEHIEYLENKYGKEYAKNELKK